LSAEQLLSSGEYGDSIVVADLEAGIGTMTRLDEAQIDLTLVVVEPTPRSLDVGARAIGIAREKKQGRIVVVVNKAEDVEDDAALVRDRLGDVELVLVPNDAAVLDADRTGVALLDYEPNSPAVLALESLTDFVPTSGSG
jgi:CO dehydrogenase maturation factor